MTETPEQTDPTADHVYEAALEPRQRGRLERLVAGVAEAGATAIGGPLHMTGGGDIVVRRREDGGEEVRIPVGDAEEGSTVLAHVRDQLAAMTPAEFLATWSTEPA